jgi:hypothetical protein
MTWSYDPEMPTTKDEVRFLIGDTDTTDQQLSNEEVAYLLSEFGSPVLAAQQAAQALAAKFSRLVTKEVGDLRIEYSDRAKAYASMADALGGSTAAAVGNAQLYAGGISIAEKEVDASDEDLVQPYFTTGLMDNRTKG